jgi:tRNA threonylcarbamoyladenosine modification (KEOPS) complex  Pcc1 subunit
MLEKYNCLVKLSLGETAAIVAKSLKPELDSKHNKRSETKIKLNKGVLSLNIKALDAVALRASLNSNLKLIGLVQKVLEVEYNDKRNSTKGNGLRTQQKPANGGFIPKAEPANSKPNPENNA